MSIGINWAEVWGPVWAQVWAQSVAPPAPEAQDNSGGWPVPVRRKKPVVREAEVIEVIEPEEVSTARLLAQQRADAEVSLMVEQYIERQRQEEEDLLLILVTI